MECVTVTTRAVRRSIDQSSSLCAVSYIRPLSIGEIVARPCKRSRSRQCTYVSALLGRTFVVLTLSVRSADLSWVRRRTDPTAHGR